MLSSPASLFCLYSPGYLIHSYTFSISSILKFRILTAPSWTSALNIRPIYTTVYFTTWMSTIHLKLNMLKHSSCCLFPTPTKRKIFSVFFSPPFLLMMVSLFQLHRPKAWSFSMFFFLFFYPIVKSGWIHYQLIFIIFTSTATTLGKKSLSLV